MEDDSGKIERLDLNSMDMTNDRIEALRSAFPEAIHDGKVDFDYLRSVLGEWIEPEKERFGLTWAGKAECMKVIQQPSVGTLVPVRDESVDFDNTENLIIEGDNLEVLKLLQKSYYGKVKMIYIDPPYNTGNEFIYPDDYKEGLNTYLKYTGQYDESGLKLEANTESSGRYHSKWLSMMYPRLYLVRNLLRDDGVIFVSIDDNEVANLRKLLDEIFGEENSLTEAPTTLIWQRSGTTAGHIANSHEYILVYTKNKKALPFFKLSNYGEDAVIKHGALKKISKANPASEITFPKGFSFEGTEATFKGELGGSEKEYIQGEMQFRQGQLVAPVTIKAGWAMRDQILAYINGKETFDTKGQKVIRFYFNREGILFYEKERGTFHPKTIVPKEVGSTQSGSKELTEIFGQKVFEFPKPSTLLKYLLSFTTSQNDIILDFFAGSGTTAHAVMKQNAEDGGNRKFILVQLPEPTGREDYPTISAITRERVRRAGKAILSEQPTLGSTSPDCGFKAYKLTTSNFKVWDSENSDEKSVQRAIDEIAVNVVTGRSKEDILTELILKVGYPPTTPISEIACAGLPVYSIAEGALLICLERKLSIEAIEAMADTEPSMIIVLDEGFGENDELKVNAMETIRLKNRNMASDIVLRVV
ncbi:MAG: site-specific DNA-methyltransferase [Actinobacteria bacterium]|nr:site-specific DNA-methyltransferase [Actinomycetota bacterium]MCL6104847.1 site-specific DNA-methyltransferase [Actinomycetota bacterium]